MSAKQYYWTTRDALIAGDEKILMDHLNKPLAVELTDDMKQDLLYTIIRNDNPKMVKILMNHPFDMFAPGENPLVESLIKSSDIGKTVFLINRGAKLYIKKSISALDFAIYNNFILDIKILTYHFFIIKVSDNYRIYLTKESIDIIDKSRRENSKIFMIHSKFSLACKSCITGKLFSLRKS